MERYEVVTKPTSSFPSHLQMMQRLPYCANQAVGLDTFAKFSGQLIGTKVGKA
jgi:hypothetical protein